jgi:hypothetical protein
MGLAYWIWNPMDSKDLLALHAIRRGYAPHDDFTVAYFIAEELVSWDQEEKTLTITEKGYDALECHKHELEHQPPGLPGTSHTVKLCDY